MGDGTRNNLTPLLTGFHTWEIPNGTKNEPHVDMYPFIWNDYKKAGYVTAYMEDASTDSTFGIFKVSK